MEKPAINCIKVVLSGGKVVLLREMKLKYQNLAFQALGNKAKDNQMYAAALLGQELMKILIIKIDERDVKASQMEQLDELFTFPQIQQLQKVIGKMMGGDDDLGELTTEFVSIGGQ